MSNDLEKIDIEEPELDTPERQSASAGFDGNSSSTSDSDSQEKDDLPIHEVYGSPENIARLGSPVDCKDKAHVRYYFYPTWRSQIFQLGLYFILCWFSIAGSNSKYLSFTVIGGELFSIGDTTFMLHLPMLVLIPGFLLGKILLYIYDSKYIIDDNGVEAQIGLVSLSLRQPRLRYEDIRGVEPNQTILERILGVGSVLVGSAMTQDVEITMSGVANPRAIQLLIGAERDKHLKLLQKQSRAKAVSVTGD